MEWSEVGVREKGGEERGSGNGRMGSISENELGSVRHACELQGVMTS